VILLTSFYDSGNEQRNAELLECWSRNERCPAFEKIYGFVHGQEELPLPAQTKTVRVLGTAKRPTYKDFFDFANKTFPAGVVCLANADIWFDETLLNITDAQLDRRTFFACSRWGFTAHPNGQWFWDEGYDLNAPVSQDAWIFRTPLEWNREVNDLAFELGHMRCDNVLAWTMQQSGYRVLNPTLPGPKSLKLHHEHRSQVHSYGAAVPGPMIFVHPIQLG
jgi:hypothetical protein